MLYHRKRNRIILKKIRRSYLKLVVALLIRLKSGRNYYVRAFFERDGGKNYQLEKWKIWFLKKNAYASCSVDIPVMAMTRDGYPKLFSLNCEGIDDESGKDNANLKETEPNQFQIILHSLAHEIVPKKKKLCNLLGSKKNIVHFSSIAQAHW